MDAEGVADTAFVRQVTTEVLRSSELRPDTKIVIKPNLCYPVPKAGVTTSSGWLGSVIAALRTYTEHITVVESDGMRRAWTADEVFANHGVFSLCRQYGIRAVNLTRESTRKASTSVSGKEVTLQLPDLLFDTDVFVTVPVPKIHSMTTVSIGLKNQWGCLPDALRFRYHHRFAEIVVAVNKIIRPRLSFVDGGYFLSRRGPLEGSPIPAGIAIAGECGPVEIASCALMNVDPASVPYLCLAQENGLLPPLSASAVKPEPGYKCVLERSLTDWLALAVFSSGPATRLLYDSFLAGPIHELYYSLSGGREYPPDWSSR